MPVEAQPGSPRSLAGKTVAVLRPHCTTPALQFTSFIDSLRVELAGQELRCCAVSDAQDGAPAEAAVRVQLAVEPCDANPTLIAVRVSAPEGERDLRHDITLADVAPTALPRTLALAVAELIRASGRIIPTETPRTPAIGKENPADPPTVKSEAPLSSNPYSFSGGFELRNYPLHGSTLWGGRLAFAVAKGARHAELDLGAGVAVKSVALGRIFIQMASAGLTLGPRLALGKVMIVDLGLRGELGWAWTDAESYGPPAYSGGGSTFVANLGLRLSVQAFAGRIFRPRLDLEGGAVLRSLTAQVDGVSMAGLGGGYLLASVGFTLAPK